MSAAHIAIAALTVALIATTADIIRCWRREGILGEPIDHPPSEGAP